jgi:phosphoribosylanthranilate isomerase
MMSKFQNLTHCTLTGVDEMTALSSVESLSLEFPVVEWGFLYSPKRQGQPGRYPSTEFLRKSFQDLPQHVRVALHVCGSGVLQLIEGEPVVTELVQLVGQRGGRIQLNFSAHDISNFTLDRVRDCIQRFPLIEFITQYNEANVHVWKSLCDVPNHSVLFDASGGRGVAADAWSAPLDGVRCGYAGGLGPENVAREIQAIQSAAGDALFWIDMEGKLRDESDWFDVGACKATLEALIGAAAIDTPANKPEAGSGMGHKWESRTVHTQRCVYCGAMVNDFQSWPGRSGERFGEKCQSAPKLKLGL